MSSISNGIFGSNGGNVQPLKTTYVSTTPYQVLSTDDVILVDTATIAAASTVYLPEAPVVDGQVWTVKDESGSAATYPITVQSTDGDINIDGATTFVLSTAYESASFVWSSTLGQYFYVAEVNAGGGIATIDGDSGSVTGSTVTITGGSSGAVFTGSGSTLTMSFNDVSIGGSVVLASPGSDNTLVGAGSGSGNVENDNTLVGYNAGASAFEMQYNVALGSNALHNNVEARWNVCIGYNAGTAFAGEASNILINNTGSTVTNNTLYIGAGTGTGAQELNAAYISGIQGISVTGAAVIVSSGNQLGVTVSSARYKDNIADMYDVSTPILSLRPVTFTYKEDTTNTQAVGLIAEEVNDIMPSLVVLDKEGLPQTVKYHELPVLLLNELQKALKRIEVLEQQLSK